MFAVRSLFVFSAAVAASWPASGYTFDDAADLTSDAEPVCTSPKAAVRCFARARLNKRGTFFASSGPQGFGPADILSAYAVPDNGSAATVAVVDAFDDPTAEADLAVFRKQYGLPACTTDNGCFQKVNNDRAVLPPADDDWTLEISLDLDAVSAACPECQIILVEAKDDSDAATLLSAVSTAANLGASVISNSWGGNEYSTETSDDQTYLDHPGIAIFFASGDEGTGASYPPTSTKVFSIGGTTLERSATASRGWTETVWSSTRNGATGSGCSAFETRPAWQTSITTDCSRRASNDLAAVGDPNTGLSTYDTSNGNSGWQVVGGTSLATPIVAAIFASTGRADATPSEIYATPSDFFDVTKGSNGRCNASERLICNAGTGWDGPSGLGTPNAAAIAGIGTTGGSSGSSSGGSTGSSGSSTASSTSSSGGGGTTTGSTTGGTTSSSGGGGTTSGSTTGGATSSGGGGGTTSSSSSGSTGGVSSSGSTGASNSGTTGNSATSGDMTTGGTSGVASSPASQPGGGATLEAKSETHRGCRADNASTEAAIAAALLWLFRRRRRDERQG